VLVAAVLGASLVSRVSQALPTSQLSYVRAGGTEEACLDEAELRRAVARRVGYDPFFPWAEFDRRGAIEMGDVDGQNVHALFESGEDIMMTTVSPGGAELVISAECGVHRVKLADAAQACASPVLGSGAPRSHPAWSSGGLVAFADGWYAIHVVPAGGGEDKTVLDTRQSLGGRYVAEVAWSVPGVVVR
jgi:hypothetical protein